RIIEWSARHVFLVPSQRRYEARARSLAEGVAVPRALYAEILALAE
ncbi:MAG: hypothetical protein HUU13_15710, partial [Burkholderiaceae bacterium]|nr:hypothetical protein [Burkholderiaceae bacterium]